MKKLSESIVKGILFFYIHFVIEVVTFFILTRYIGLKESFIIYLIYDFLAFMPQGLFGYVLDENLKYPGIILGTLLALIALCLLYTNISFYVIVIIIAIASCFIHISGAEHTIRSSNGKLTPVSLFVSGGSFGLITGKILANIDTPIFVVMLICSTILITLFYFKKHPLEISETLDEYNFASKDMNPTIIVILATIVVAIRAFIGYGIPTSWNKELYQTILLFIFMGFGKALGGILIDKIGIKVVIIISTIISLPFLIWGDNIMILSIIGVMLFSMTMSITLSLIVSSMKKYPGIAFGFTTLGLFLGTLPLFIFKIENEIINVIVIIVLTIISLVVLLLITNKTNKEKQNA